MSATKNLSPRAQTKRLQVIEAAQCLFLSTGFTSTSMDTITAEAGVSKQTVYSYFASKEELFAEVLRHLIEEETPEQFTKPTTEPRLESRAALQRALTELAHSLIESLMSPTYLAMIRMTLSELQRFPQLGRYFREAVPERMMEKPAALLRYAHDHRIASVPDLDAAIRLFMGPLIMHVLLDGLLLTDAEPQPPTPERITQLVTHFMQAIPATDVRR
jgi:TetR/AcrR family transcriptional repressor of mexJK operon